ncbi:MAG: TolC family protein, partial [Ignavibacteriaceae bacterium]
MKFFLALVLFIVITNPVFSQDQLSLDEAIKIALQKNSGLISQENELSRSESALDAAYGNFLPDLGAYGSWDWRKIKPAINSGESRTYSVGASSNIVLFDGLSNYANLSRSKNSVEAIKLAIEQKKQEVVF